MRQTKQLWFAQFCFFPNTAAGVSMHSTCHFWSKPNMTAGGPTDNYCHPVTYMSVQETCFDMYQNTRVQLLRQSAAMRADL